MNQKYIDHAILAPSAANGGRGANVAHGAEADKRLENGGQRAGGRRADGCGWTAAGGRLLPASGINNQAISTTAALQMSNIGATCFVLKFKISWDLFFEIIVSFTYDFD